MSEPKRWSEDADAGELERELLGAGQAVRLPESERRALWASIALSVPAAPPALVSPKTLATTSGLAAQLTKGAIFLAAAGALGVGVARLRSVPEARVPPKTLLSVTAMASAIPAPLAASASSAPTIGTTPMAAATTTTATTTTTPALGESQPRVASESQLREESAAVLEARAALRSGDSASSLALLEQARVRFPHGGLGQEREALTIEALAEAGNTAAARQRGQAFLRAHPTSPYAADVRRIAEE